MRLIIPIFTICLLLSTLQSHAQSLLVIHENKRVQLLCNQRDSLTICSFPGARKCCGYRILVNLTDDRDAAYRLKYNLLKRYPDYIVFMSYQTPYFKLKMGDFLYEQEANAFSKRLSHDLKIATSVIPDMIYKPAEIHKIDEQPCMENDLLLLYTRK